MVQRAVRAATQETKRTQLPMSPPSAPGLQAVESTIDSIRKAQLPTLGSLLVYSQDVDGIDPSTHLIVGHYRTETVAGKVRAPAPRPRKPSYKCLIYGALARCPSGKMVLRDLHETLKIWAPGVVHPRFTDTLRHALTISPEFVQMKRGKPRGPGGYWTIKDAEVDPGLGDLQEAAEVLLLLSHSTDSPKQAPPNKNGKKRRCSSTGIDPPAKKKRTRGARTNLPLELKETKW